MTEIDHGFTTNMVYGIAGTFTGGLSSKGIRLFKKDGWYNVKKVYPISEDQVEVEGLKAYPTVSDVPEPIDVLIVVHKQEKNVAIIREASKLKKKPAIWFMPRTMSSEALAICEENDMKYGSSCMIGHRQFKGLSRLNMHLIIVIHILEIFFLTFI